jgi:anti-sigma factor (TIGR02949 family)
MKNHDMLDCESVMRQLWDYLDGELTPDREAAVREHLSMCKRCYPQYNFESAFVRALSASRRDHSRPTEIRERVLAALRADGFAA